MRVDYLAAGQPLPTPPLLSREVAREVSELVRSSPPDDQREFYILPEPGGARVADWCLGTFQRPPASWIALGKIYTSRERRAERDCYLERRIDEALHDAVERRRPNVNWRTGLLDKRPKKGETFTAQEVADYLSVSRRVVNTLGALGELEVMRPSPRARTVTRLSLVAYLEKAITTGRRGGFDRDHPPLRYLTTKQAAELLGVPSRFVVQQIHSGRLRCVSFLNRKRIASTELDAFVRATTWQHGRANEWWEPVKALLADPTPFAPNDPPEATTGTTVGSATTAAASPSPAKPLQDDACEVLIARFLKTGEESESDSFVWPGQSFKESAQRRKAVLANALVAEVERRAARVTLPRESEVHVQDIVRERVEPFVRGVLSAHDRKVVFEHLQQSVVLVTAANVANTLRNVRLSSAWGIANLYLQSIGAEPLGAVPPGVACDEMIYVSLRYLDAIDGFNDFVLRQCARTLHTKRRGDLGLRETYRKHWLLDVHHRNRDLFVRACEVWGCIESRATSARQRRGMIETFAKAYQPDSDLEVVPGELVRVLQHAAAAGNGWQRIVEVCQERQGSPPE